MRILSLFIPLILFLIYCFLENKEIQETPETASSKKAVKTVEKSAKQLIAIGDTLCNQGDASRATVYYRKALKKSRLSPQAHLHLGIALAMQKDFTQAVRICANLRTINPTYWRSFCTFGFLTYHQHLAHLHQIKKSKNKAILQQILKKYVSTT